MSYKDYWEGENRLPFFYLKAEEKRQHRQLNEHNMMAWLNGYYNMQAFGVILSNAFSKNNAVQAKYPNKPIELFENEQPGKQLPEEEQKQAEMAVEVALDNFVAALGGRRKHG